MYLKKYLKVFLNVKYFKKVFKYKYLSLLKVKTKKVKTKKCIWPYVWWLVMVTDDRWHLLDLQFVVVGDSYWKFIVGDICYWLLVTVAAGDIYRELMTVNCSYCDHYFVTVTDLQWWVMKRVGIRRQLILNDDSTWEMLTVSNADFWWRVTRKCRASFSKLMTQADSELSILTDICGCWQWVVNADSHIWLLTVSCQYWQSYMAADSESSMLTIIYGCWQWVVNADSHIWLLTVSHQCWQSYMAADSESSMLTVIYGCWQWVINADSHIWLLTVSC